MHLSREALVEAQHLGFQRRHILARWHRHAADPQEVRQNAIARDRGDGLRVELNAVQFMVTVAKAP